MELWRKTWRDGLVRQFSDNALEALATALLDDDPRIVQGLTVVPSVAFAVPESTPSEACAIGFCGWIGEGLETIGEVNEYFARVAYECDVRLNKAASIRHFANWFDDAPRAEALPALLIEVRAEQHRRRLERAGVPA